VADAGSPILYGIPTNLAVYSDRGESFSAGGGGGGRGGGGGGGGAAAAGAGGRGAAGTSRPTGRGTPDDPDVVQGRPAGEGNEPALPPLPGDSAAGGGGGGGGRGGGITVPPELRPRPLLRFETQDKLLVSGLLDGGADIAGQNVVVDLPSEKGHYILFANNPIYRGETIGSYFMVFNAILNFDNLGAGRAADTGGGGGGRGGRGGAGGGGNK
jgi:hypothetical protein